MTAAAHAGQWRGSEVASSASRRTRRAHMDNSESAKTRCRRAGLSAEPCSRRSSVLLLNRPSNRAPCWRRGGIITTVLASCQHERASVVRCPLGVSKPPLRGSHGTGQCVYKVRQSEWIRGEDELRRLTRDACGRRLRSGRSHYIAPGGRRHSGSCGCAAQQLRRVDGVDWFPWPRAEAAWRSPGGHDGADHQQRVPRRRAAPMSGAAVRAGRPRGLPVEARGTRVGVEHGRHHVRGLF